MAKIIESVPNISEGVRTDVIESCVDAVRTTPGCTLLQHSSDPSHNRTVITYMGSPEGVEEASVKLAKAAVSLIDLTQHKGEHPRMGCVDVMPFIPIKETTMEECIELSKRVGQRIAEEAFLPVFLYEASATAPHRQNLANIRKGQFEGMAEKVRDPAWIPDFGWQRVHPTGGVVAVGARPPLIAYNINLSTSDVSIADRIAKIIRQAGGGLANVKAIGIMLEERNIAQVSINMTDYTKTPLYRVTELVKAEAARYGAHVVGTELIGLCPMNALIDSAAYYLQIEDFDRDVQVIENHLL
ncbi:MAG: glutamate formimidoyltransferase [Clostridiales bacterium]|nr:glutamate formimidoyltransferase [Clostridiales bacterium]